MSSTAERQGIGRKLVGSWWHLPQIPDETKKVFWRWYYSRISSRRDPEIMLLDYGYAADLSETDAGTEDDHFGLALYEAVAGAVELAGKDVLEVGCGRGGGAAHVFEAFSPRALTGVDLAKPAIVMARERYGRPGIHFAIADAEDLPYPDGLFDAVLNVESSHCYPDVGRFLSEARRVLRDDGVLLLTDFRRTGGAPREGAKDVRGESVDDLRRQFADAGLTTVQEQDITPNVVRALQLSTPHLRERIERKVPRPFQKAALEFSGVEGSTVYNGFANGDLKYLRFVLAKS